MNTTASSLRIVFAGTPEFSARHLYCLISSGCNIVSVYTQPDRPKGRGKKVLSSPVKQLAELHNLPIYQPASLRSEETQAELRAQQADLMVVVAYGLLLPDEVLSTPKLGCINVHASLLPRWRGAAPIQRAILAGDEQSGVTIMQMDEGLDTGAMLAETVIPIYSTETAASLHDRLIEAGCPALLQTIEAIADQMVTATPQDNDAALYAPKLTSAEAQIDWSGSAGKVDRQIRAFNPVPGAWMMHKDERVKVWAGEILESLSANSLPGRISAVSDSGIDIETAKGAIRLTEIQPAGKNRMSVRDFLRGNPTLFTTNEVLGPAID